jgi:ankyrin repeat protein
MHNVCRHGADIDAEDLAGNSPAHMAAAQGHLPLLSALLQVLRTCKPDALRAYCQMRPLECCLLHASVATSVHSQQLPVCKVGATR